MSKSYIRQPNTAAAQILADIKLCQAAINRDCAGTVGYVRKGGNPENAIRLLTRTVKDHTILNNAIAWIDDAVAQANDSFGLGDPALDGGDSAFAPTK